MLFKPKKNPNDFLETLETITRKGINSTKAVTTTAIARTVASSKRKNS